MNTNQNDETTTVAACPPLSGGLAADRTGYCAWCKHVPDGLIGVAAENPDSKCHLCWFTDEKPNWEKAANDLRVFTSLRRRQNSVGLNRHRCSLSVELIDKRQQ